MKNMKISAKLIVSFLAITAFSVILAVIGIYASFSINNDYTYLLEEAVELQVTLKDMQFQYTMMRYRTANFAMEVNNPDIITGTLTPQFNSAYSEFNSNLSQCLSILDSDKERDPAVIKQLKDSVNKLAGLVDSFKSCSDNTRTIALSGDYDSATTSLRDVIPLANEINALFDELITSTVDYTHTESDNMDTTAVAITTIQSIVTVICVICSLSIALYMAGIIGRPVRFMKDMLYQMGGRGVVHFSDEDYRRAEQYAAGKDEIGQSLQMLIDTGRRLETVGRTLETVAAGDLTPEIRLLSEDDTIGISLQKMLENLNRMFTEIGVATNQVSIGSGQIADGAQILAQGSTEQAAAVQQLSSSIAEIAEKTKANANMATRAADLAGTIKLSAEKGSTQMDNMIAAVDEINEASKGINKVIKVIDDIAFQTNILALNAAVEAARAGQHGKGFAVVAEEVRSLAAKSAEAAKDTGGLIANSMEKAQLGAKIAGETAESFVEIVSGINESNQIVSDIAKSSEEQSVGISQINRGIEQVAQVVQQNSATAQQSAASSQQMSGQSDMLEELISRFKLKSSTSGFNTTLGASSPKRLPPRGSDFGG